MEKPDFKEVIAKLEDYSQNLKDNSQIGNSRLILAYVEMIKVMGWSSSQQDTNNTQIANLTDEIKTLHKNLKNYSSEASKESVWMRRVTIVMMIVAGFQLLIGIFQYKLGEAQIDWAHEQFAGQNAALFYEKLHDESIEKRDIQWRKEDLQFQGRLPK